MINCEVSQNVLQSQTCKTTTITTAIPKTSIFKKDNNQYLKVESATSEQRPRIKNRYEMQGTLTPL